MIDINHCQFWFQNFQHEFDNNDNFIYSAWAKKGNILNRLTAFIGVSENQNKINYLTNNVSNPIIKADHISDFEERNVEYSTMINYSSSSRK